MRFALFVSAVAGIAVAVYAEKARQGANSGAGDANAEGQGDSAPCTLCEAVNSIIEPLKDEAVAISRAVFGTPYDALIESSANEYGIPPATLYRLLRQESRFRPDIIEGRTVSPVGALGIAQFMPATAAELGIDPLDPQQAIPAAARYLARLRHLLGGDLDAAVAAYNWGIGNVKRKGLAKAPRETRAYVAAITGTVLPSA